MHHDPIRDEIAKIKSSPTRVLKIALGMISLAALSLGLAINWYAGEVGLVPEVANAASFGMLLAAIAHALALSMWDRPPD